MPFCCSPRPLWTLLAGLISTSLPGLRLYAQTAPTTGPASQSVATTQPKNPQRFESVIRGYEEKDKGHPPLPAPTVFVGSSTFTRWKQIETEFQTFRAINRAFGGSTFPDVLYYLDRIVLAYQPARVVVYEGTNDIALKRTPEQVANDFQTFVTRIHQILPETQIYFVSATPAPVRAKMAAEMDQANALVQQFIAADSRLHYINTRRLLLDEKGEPDPQYYMPDRLHPNSAGYARWAPAIRAALEQPTTQPAGAGKDH